jgi:hypothetical protein
MNSECEIKVENEANETKVEIIKEIHTDEIVEQKYLVKEADPIQITKDTFSFEILEKIFLEMIDKYKKGVKTFEYEYDNKKYVISYSEYSFDDIIKFAKSNCKYCYGKGYSILLVAKSTRKIHPNNLIIIDEDNQFWKTKDICNCVVNNSFKESVYMDSNRKIFLKLFMKEKSD